MLNGSPQEVGLDPSSASWYEKLSTLRMLVHETASPLSVTARIITFKT